MDFGHCNQVKVMIPVKAIQIWLVLKEIGIYTAIIKGQIWGYIISKLYNLQNNASFSQKWLYKVQDFSMGTGVAPTLRTVSSGSLFRLRIKTAATINTTINRTNKRFLLLITIISLLFFYNKLPMIKITGYFIACPLD